MKTLAAFLFLFCVCYSSAFFTNKPIWKWHDCCGLASTLKNEKIIDKIREKFGFRFDLTVPSTRVLTILTFEMSPTPLKIPGNATITLIGNLTHTLPAHSHYRLNVTMDKELLGHWHKVPCRNNVGTCLYDDPCEFLQQFAHNHSCPKAFIDHGLSCTCPFNPVSLNVTPSTIPITSIPAAWQFLATGDFKARVEVLSGQTMIGCFEVELSIETPCTGFLCGGG